MDFSLSEDQILIKQIADKFSKEKLLPDYQKRESDSCIDPDLIREMGQLGLIGSDLSAVYGGNEVDGVTSGLIIEALAYGDINVSYIQLLASLLGGVVQTHAAEELRAEYLPLVIQGEKLLSLGLTEPQTGSDAANLRLKATRDGDDYILNGEKASISMATCADLMVLFARTGAADSRSGGVSGFLVPLDLPGIKRSRYTDLGTRVVGRGSVFFDNVRIPASWMLGDEHKGFSQIMCGFDYSRALIALQCLASAQASLDQTWQYVQERETFNAPLVKYQGVNFPLAEHESIIEATRVLCYKTLSLRDSNLPHTKEAAMVKWMGPKYSVNAIHDCLLLHGHAGYSTDMAHQQRLRDVMGLEIGDGTAQIMKIIIAREIAGNASVQYK
ncbi:MAG: cyclohexanecarboxyl-CoA dehydrogenase [Gammaproteobacteria bacterium]|nr:MAG: cyclohexanecarboxyl-CoA dehydrogenase [Gammaproteobacteria bacterium]